VTGWQREYKLAEDELDDPRALALPDWNTLTVLADALVAQSAGRYRLGDAVIFEHAPRRASVKCRGASCGYQHGRVDLDNPPPNNTVPWWIGGQEHQGKARARSSVD